MDFHKRLLNGYLCLLPTIPSKNVTYYLIKCKSNTNDTAQFLQKTEHQKYNSKPEVLMKNRPPQFLCKTDYLIDYSVLKPNLNT